MKIRNLIHLRVEPMKFLILFLFLSSTVSATTYYIDPSGNDVSGTGTIALPWKSLRKACTVVKTQGDIIHVNPGTYTETGQCILFPGVSIEGEGNTSIITTTTLTAEWTAIIEGVSDPVVNGNQSISYLKFDGHSLAAAQAINIEGRHNVKIHNCTFVDFNYMAVSWKGIGGDEVNPPTAYVTGSEFYNNTVTNCAGYGGGWYRGALFLGCHDGMLIHDNNMVETGRPLGTQGWPIKWWFWGGWMKGCKIYNNHLEKTDCSVWPFAIEGLYSFGLEIYNNTIIGAIDLNDQLKGTYDYSVYIHDNIIGPPALGTYAFPGIILEYGNESVIIERNYLKNCSPAFLFTPRSGNQNDVNIRYNVCENIGAIGWYSEGLRVLESSNITITNFYIQNNVFSANASGMQDGIIIDSSDGTYTGNNMRFINNIFVNFSHTFLELTSAGAVNNLYVENNIIYNCGNGNLPVYNGTPLPYTFLNNKPGINPLFVSSTDFHLQAGSPAIDAGKDVGLTLDYIGNAVPFNSIPDIGAYEYGSSPPPSAPPVYLLSSIGNATPNILEMSYNLTLANIIPANSAFSVFVNSVARTVSSVAISGTKVLLTLSSPVVYGDVVTIAYTKPATNPLQTSSGGQASALTAQSVTNSVIAIPAYVSSVVANASPSVLEMTYSLSLANIIPAASAFSVMVNSVARSIGSVAISGTKVLLTLSTPVVFGDIITVAYTKPATNPLQTSAGGLAVSLTAQAVTNSVAAVSVPVYQSSVVTNATPSVLEMTYSLSLANIVPATTAFSVMVNSVARTVSSVAIAGTKVLLTLSTPIVFGDIITVAYAKPATNPLQTSAGGQAASLTSQTVTNSVSSVSVPVYQSSVVTNTTPSVLEMTYSLSLANIVPATSVFSVLVNSVARTVSSVAISGTKVLLTLSAPIVFGDIITVAYVKPATNPLQTTAGGQAASLTAQAVTNSVALVSVPVYQSSVVANATPSLLEMTYDLSLANIVPATSAFSVLVNSIARTVSSVAISGTKVRLTLSSPIVNGDIVTVAYSKPATNPLQTPAGGQASSLTAQPVTNSVNPVSIPVYQSSIITNITPSLLEMTYSLSLANIIPATTAFSVLVNSVATTVNSVAISGAKVILTLVTPVVYGDIITVAYTKPATNPLQTSAGGQAANLTAQPVANSVAAVTLPIYQSAAVTNETPSVLEITFSLGLANIVPSPSAFTVIVNSVARTVSSVSVSGTKVLLTIANPAVYGDIITVSYTKPATNQLQTPAGGQASSISNQAVVNLVGSTDIPLYVNSVIENSNPDILSITFSFSLANIVPDLSSFEVIVNSLSRTITSVTISGTKVLITLSSPVIYGDIISVAYTKPASNPLQSNAGGQAPSMVSQLVTNSVNPIDDEQGVVLTIFPNPTKGEWDIVLNKPAPKDIIFRIYSISGIIVDDFKISQDGTSYHFSKTLNPGTYIIQGILDNLIFSVDRLIISK